MSEQEEQPRPSLRLRKTPDRPPAAPPEPPKAPEPAPAPEQKEKGEATPRLRLSAMIKPGSGDSAAVTPPTPPQPPQSPPSPPPAPPSPPPAAQPPPKPVEQTPPNAPPFSPFPEKQQEPKPEPAAVVPPPAPPAQPPPPFPPPPKPADQGLPVVEQPRQLQFPQEEENKEEEPEPKPPSPRAVGIAIFGVLLLVVGGVAYLLFVDPFGLFKNKQPQQPPPAVVSKPAPTQAPTPAPKATTPAPVAVAPSESTASPAATTSPKAQTTTASEEASKEYKMPPPAPLQGGEEIAPGVVRLPRDADSVTAAPEATPYEPPPPKQNPAYIALVNNLNITGIRANSSGGFLMVKGVLYRPGDIVDEQTKLVFVSIDGQVVTFKDPLGVTYTRRF